MIVVDTTVWIDWLGDLDGEAVEKLDEIEPSQILVGDIVLLELLQGFRTEKDAATAEQLLRRFEIAPMVGVNLAVKAAANYRALRKRGITVRSSIDTIIGTFCIEHDHALLTKDRDFDPMAEHLGLRLA